MDSWFSYCFWKKTRIPRTNKGRSSAISSSAQSSLALRLFSNNIGGEDPHLLNTDFIARSKFAQLHRITWHTRLRLQRSLAKRDKEDHRLEKRNDCQTRSCGLSFLPKAHRPRTPQGSCKHSGLTRMSPLTSLA
jgi:hypothetical protein